MRGGAGAPHAGGRRTGQRHGDRRRRRRDLGRASSSRATSVFGAITRYASSHSSAISSQSGSRSSRHPSQPRCPTYGGRKNRSGSPRSAPAARPAAPRTTGAANSMSWCRASHNVTNALLPADEPGRRAVAEPLGHLGKRQADRPQPLVVHDAYSARVLIATERLVLRRFRAADAETLAAYRSDPAVARYQSWDAAVPLTEAVQTVAAFAPATPTSPAGSSTPSSHRDGVLSAMSASTWTRTSCRPRSASRSPRRTRAGAMRPRRSAGCSTTSSSTGAAPGLAECDARNTASARLLERVGFTQRGVAAVQHTWFKGEWTDDRYGLLAAEWSWSPDPRHGRAVAGAPTARPIDRAGSALVAQPDRAQRRHPQRHRGGQAVPRDRPRRAPRRGCRRREPPYSSLSVLITSASAAGGRPIR